MDTTLDRGDGHMAQKGRGIFLVYVDIDAKDAKEFNEWYNTEHLPELLAVPGILAAARYQAVKGGPQYLACYELANVEVMHTPAFTNRPRTPWGQRVSPSVIGENLTRIVGEQIFPDGIDMPDRGMAPVLQYVRARRGRCGVERLVQWRIYSGLSQGAGSDLRPPLSGTRGHQRVYHGLRVCQYCCARKHGVEGATATFVPQFPAHAAGDDACTRVCRGVHPD
jgi:hypothetical protein